MRRLAVFLAFLATPVLAETKAPVVLVETAKRSEIADTITYPARVASKVKAQVLATADGLVSALPATLGKSVRAGEVLARIKNTDPVYEYVAVPVESPVAGVVSVVEVSQGSRVTKGAPLVTILDPRQTKILVEVPAADLAHVRVGLTGTITVGAQKPVAVKVSGVSPLIDPLTGTATAELTAAAPVPVGAIGRVSFAVNARQGIQVPEQAIVYRGKETLLRTVENGKAKMTPVTIVETRKGMTEIAGGLKEGAKVIVRASGFVADGQDVVAEEADVAKK